MVKMLADKPEELSSISRTYTGKGTFSCRLFSDFHTHPQLPYYMSVHVHTYKIKKCKFKT